MFKTRKYTIRFDKHIFVKEGNTYEIPDADLLKGLLKLQDEFKDFKIKRVNFDHSSNEVVIRCCKEDKIGILARYCDIVDGAITRVSIH